jgi:biotin carboxyl carrier protein
MRRYTIVVNGRNVVLDVRELESDRFQVQYGEREIDVQLVDETDLPEAAITPVMTKAMGIAPVAPAHPPAPTNTGSVAPVPVARPAVTNTATVTVARSLTAPMPGVITSIEVTAGQQVKRGQTLVNLEAMKMVNAIRAPRDAVVSEILVKAQQQVAFGDELMKFEEPAK